MGKYNSVEDYVESIEQMDKSVRNFSREVLVKTLKAIPSYRAQPSKLKKGDVFMYNINDNKYRPVVVIKIEDGVVYGLAISSKEDCLNLCPSLSRFFGEGFLSKGLVVTTVEKAKSKFAGIYDNPKRLHSAIKMLKEQLFDL